MPESQHQNGTGGHGSQGGQQEAAWRKPLGRGRHPQEPLLYADLEQTFTPVLAE